MAYENWKDKRDGFRKIDVRKMQGNFFPAIKKAAEETEPGSGIEVIQTFEPMPLYGVLEEMGFERHVEEVAESEFHVWFYRAEKKEAKGGAPFRPIALLNYPLIDEKLGQVAVEFWNLTWNDDRRTIPYDMRLMLSLMNAVGAGRYRQASRELIKAYAYGTETAVFDDVFELIAWNQGIGYFSSEIGPSALFQAYRLIKTEEEKGAPRDKILETLKEKYGEKNPEVGVR